MMILDYRGKGNRVRIVANVVKGTGWFGLPFHICRESFLNNMTFPNLARVSKQKTSWRAYPEILLGKAQSDPEQIYIFFIFFLK